ncbi:hypothetical protein Ciccas_003739, partial [Cichlidogyrus casuarinus]
QPAQGAVASVINVGASEFWHVPLESTFSGFSGVYASGLTAATGMRSGKQFPAAETSSLKSDSSEYAVTNQYGVSAVNQAPNSPSHSGAEDPVGYARTGISLLTKNVDSEFDMSTFRRRHSTTAYNTESQRGPQRPSDLKRQHMNGMTMRNSQTPGPQRRPQLGAIDAPTERTIPYRRSSSVSRETAMNQRYQSQYATRAQLGLDSCIYGGVKVLPATSIQDLLRSRQKSLEPFSRDVSVKKPAFNQNGSCNAGSVHVLKIWSA